MPEIRSRSIDPKCCAALEDALCSKHPLINQLEDGSYMVSVGFLLPEENFGFDEPGFLDQVMRYCPFCGTEL